MRVMQSPWGIAAVATAGILAAMLAVATIAVLVALTVFLVRRSRAVLPPTER